MTAPSNITEADEERTGKLILAYCETFNNTMKSAYKPAPCIELTITPQLDFEFGIRVGTEMFFHRKAVLHSLEQAEVLIHNAIDGFLAGMKAHMLISRI